MISTFEAAVHSLYFAYYGRPADPDGLAFWSQQLERADGDIGAIADVFANAEEATVRFGGDSTAERVAGVYQQLFNRAPDADGLRFWSEAVDAGHTTLADVALNILQGAQGSDVVISGRRLKAAEDFTTSVAAGQIAYGGYAAIEASRVLLAAIDADTTEAEIAAMVTKVGKLVNIAHDTPEVLAALGADGELAPLFATARGRAEPGDLFDAVIDVAVMAAGSAATLASLLRGGGIEAMLEAMPARATLHDVVEALGKGGLEAAIGVVYPPKPTPTPRPTPVPEPAPDPTPEPAPLPTYVLKEGVLTVSGGGAASEVLVMLPSRIDVDGMTVLIDGFNDVESVVLDDFKGKIAMLGTLDEIAAAAPKSPGIAYQIADGKDAIFGGTTLAPTLAAGIEDLLLGASVLRIMDPLSKAEHDLLVGLKGFDPTILDAQVDDTAPSISGIAFAQHDGVLAVGDSVQLEVKFKEQVYVEEGTTIQFANGGSAVYVKGNYGTTLTFEYTVEAGQDTASLALDADQPLHGAIFDRAGNPLPLDAFEALPLGNAPAVEAPTEEEAGPLQVKWSKVVGSLENADVVFAFEGDLGSNDPVQASVGQWGGKPEVDTLAGTVTLRGVDLSAAGSAVKVTLVDSAGEMVDAQLDLHVGDAQDDVLAGGDGSDYLYGGGGRNTYIGGKGADHIQIGSGENNDLVFKAGDSTAWNMDVVALPDHGLQQQTLRFSEFEVTALLGFTSPDMPDGDSPEALLAFFEDISPFYMNEYHNAAEIELGNQDRYLIIDTGSGAVDAEDIIIKLVGDYSDIHLRDGTLLINMPI